MNKIQTKELDFAIAQEQIESRIAAYLKTSQQQITKLPKLYFEKGNTILSFLVDSIDEKLFYYALEIITKHMESVRIHTFESGYIIVQDAGSLGAPYTNVNQGIRFKFISLTQKKKLEIQKSSNFRENEVQSCIELFSLFHPSLKKTNPRATLEDLGALVYTPDTNNSGFKNFVGYDSVQEEVWESVILPLKNPAIFKGVAQATRGLQAQNLSQAVLFQGPAGVGKTTVARLIGQETNIPIIYIPIENILSKYYGESAQNLARIFDTALLYQKAIIFVDEIDALATSREKGLFEATRRLLSVLLIKLDGFEKKEGLLMIGATNRTEDLDPALISRFDTIIHFPLPSKDERSLIFHNYAAHIDASNLEKLAEYSKGLAGRDIEDICEYTERRWARKLSLEQREISAPPQEFYLETCKKRQEKLLSLKKT